MTKNPPDYLNFTTLKGVDLARVAQVTASHFLIHVCGYQSQLADWHHDRVDSPFWRLYYNLSPGAFIQTATCPIQLDPDHVVLIPANSLFDCRTDHPADHFYIHFTLSSTSCRLSAPQAIPISDLLRHTLTAATALVDQPTCHLRDRRLLHHCTAALHLAFADLDQPLPPPLPDPLHALLHLIENNPDTDLSIPSLSRRVRMTSDRFTTWFRQHLGTTPAAHVAATRLRLAQRALLLTSHSIDQIAADHGYANRHYFSRVFARHIGCGPAEFRDRQGKRRGR